MPIGEYNQCKKTRKLIFTIIMKMIIPLKLLTSDRVFDGIAFPCMNTIICTVFLTLSKF